ncbi:Predicted histone tail methylase containing SET domain [Plasmopara halstedii]|uniref:Predicted histone tail methylase containing SET domain n=1 Tax=Plasmopara halstedii TaxID=4781 RepID=A0A0N7L8C8_PLAHL|nr:Predicted histone tail methylase containing SET domain [Plasmopara halstedii]CEG49515.1 Predicted histone tail methylase containing SET domain [Plasmopara halstedii]|eukprot:XP_024585884.1 Predicted histone tail methylase containing SET domain [Plasmopara halstedii]
MLSSSVQAAFELFDDDSSEDETSTPSVKPHEILPTISVAATPLSMVKEMQAITTENTRILSKPWDDVQALVVGPIDLVMNVNGVGGSRGYVAMEDLKPGTLVLVEQVYLPWPSDLDNADPDFFLATMESVLSQPDYATIMNHLSHLYPEKLNELPEELLAAGKLKYGVQVDELCRNFSELALSHEQMLQNIFAMQCNAFDSGVFLLNAMFNHDCNPNCVKFTPENAGSEAGLSEVRVVQSINKGEQLTISYLYPREQCREKRQEHLWKQFGFKCCCELCRRGDSVLPVPSLGTDKALKPSVVDLEIILVNAEDILRRKPGEAADALSVALETLSDALEIVSHDHIIYMRIHKLVADSCDLLLRMETGRVCEYSILFLRSSYELLELQRAYLKSDHIDLARTLNDVSQGIQLLLSYDPKVLFIEFPEWRDFRQASIVENQYRQEYRRLKQMYE